MSHCFSPLVVRLAVIFINILNFCQDFVSLKFKYKLSMKTISLLCMLTISGLTTLAQDAKCLAFSNKIIVNTQGELVCHTTYEDFYCMKAGFPEKFDLETIKTICDTTAKTTKVSFNWRLNYDRNPEKEFIVSGKKLLITIYYNDKFLYFEFPKE